MITVFVIIVQWSDKWCQRNQKCSDFQQITKCNKAIHCNHLPAVQMSSGSRNKPPTVIGMPSNASIPHFYKNVKQKPPHRLSEKSEGVMRWFVFLRQHRTKPAWRLCTQSACRFSVILPRNPLPYGSMPAEFLCNLPKNLTTHLTHKLCAVLP